MIARRFEVSARWVYEVKERYETSRARCSRPVGGYRRSCLVEMESTIRAWIKAEPGVTLMEMCERLVEQGITIKVPVLWHQLVAGVKEALAVQGATLALPAATAKGLSALYPAVVMGKPITSEVFALKMRGDSTRKGCTSRISRPTCGLQLIQMMSRRSGTQGARFLRITALAATTAPRPALRLS